MCKRPPVSLPHVVRRTLWHALNFPGSFIFYDLKGCTFLDFWTILFFCILTLFCSPYRSSSPSNDAMKKGVKMLLEILEERAGIEWLKLKHIARVILQLLINFPVLSIICPLHNSELLLSESSFITLPLLMLFSLGFFLFLRLFPYFLYSPLPHRTHIKLLSYLWNMDHIWFTNDHLQYLG